jgi:hypothetical protein
MLNGTFEKHVKYTKKEIRDKINNRKIVFFILLRYWMHKLKTIFLY